MMNDLHNAKLQSADFPDAEPIEPVTLEHTGRRGRPRVIIDPDVLETSYTMRGPTELGRIFNVSSRLVRRRQGGVGIKKRHLGSNFFFQWREANLPTT